MPVLLFLGDVSIGVAIPLFLQLSLAIELLIPGLLAEITAKLAGYAKLQLSLSITPPSLSASIDLTAKIAASLQAALSLGFVPPSVDFAGAAVLALIVQLQIQLGALQAALDLALQIKGLCAAGGIRLFVYKGPLSSLGATLDAQVSAVSGLAPASAIYAPLFVVDQAAHPETVAALGQVFKSN